MKFVPLSKENKLDYGKFHFNVAGTSRDTRLGSIEKTVAREAPGPPRGWGGKYYSRFVCYTRQSYGLSLVCQLAGKKIGPN